MASLVHGADEAGASGAVRLGALLGGRRRQHDAHLVLAGLLTFPNNLARNLTCSVSSHGSKAHDFNDTISNPEKYGRELRAELWREHVAGSYP